MSEEMKRDLPGSPAAPEEQAAERAMADETISTAAPLGEDARPASGEPSTDQDGPEPASQPDYPGNAVPAAEANDPAAAQGVAQPVSIDSTDGSAENKLSEAASGSAEVPADAPVEGSAEGQPGEAAGPASEDAGDAIEAAGPVPVPDASAKGRRKKKAKPPLSRRQVLTRFAVRLVCFVLVLSAVLCYGVYVLTPKHDYGICPMINMYRLPRNTVDVLTIGSSVAYTGVNTNVLWQEYGLACYNLCAAEQPFWFTYYQLREALRYQRPKVILMDAKAAVYTRDYSMRARTILSSFGILNPVARAEAIIASQKTLQKAMDFIWAYPQVHNNYKDVKWKDFQVPPDNGGRGTPWKGYIETDEMEPHDFPYVSKGSSKTKINPRQAEYARKIIELAQAEGIPIRIIAFPNPDYGNDVLYYQGLWQIAAEYGVEVVDYNDYSLNVNLDYFTDFADWQHLNVKGSMKFSIRLGRDLVGSYNLPDRRGDPAYDSYRVCTQNWYDKLSTFATAPQPGEQMW